MGERGGRGEEEAANRRGRDGVGRGDDEGERWEMNNEMRGRKEGRESKRGVHRLGEGGTIFYFFLSFFTMALGLIQGPKWARPFRASSPSVRPLKRLYVCVCVYI